MRRQHAVALLCALMLLTAGPAGALPRFALMTGARCASCHVNPTGGQMRTEYGISFSADKLPLEALKDSEFTFSHKLNENISIGADYRSQFIYDAGSQTTTFQAMTTALYGTVTLGKKLSFYFKDDILTNGYGSLNGPEMFVLAKILPNSGFVKIGDFLPDYGLRVDDHTAYTRGGDLGFLPGLGGDSRGYSAGLFFVPGYKDIGAEIGAYLGGLSLTAGLFDGTGNQSKFTLSKQKAYLAKLEYFGPVAGVNVIVGVSGYEFNSMSMGGIHAGFGTGDVSILGEIDWTRNFFVATLDDIRYRSEVNPGGNSMAAYIEADARAINGVWLIGRFDMFDPVSGRMDDWQSGDPQPNYNSAKRITLGMEFFPYSFIEFRPQFRHNIETPEISNDQFLIQTHVWY